MFEIKIKLIDMIKETRPKATPLLALPINHHQHLKPNIDTTIGFR